jgi:hypothetical protein
VQQLSDSLDVHHDPSLMYDSIATLIVSQDEGDFHSLTLKQFANVLVVVGAASHLCQNVLLSAKVMLARIQMLTADAEDRLLSCPHHEAEYREDLRSDYVHRHTQKNQMLAFYKRLSELVHQSIGISSTIGIEQWNTVVLLMLGTYCFLLALSGSQSDKDFYYSAAAVLTAVHALEVLMRVWLVGGLWGFVHDRRGFQRGFSNIVSLVLVSAASIAMVLYVTLPSEYEKLTQSLACLQLWRVLVLIPEYNELTFSFLALGIPSIVQFMWLLLIVMYVFCSVAHYIFQDVVSADANGSVDFTTLQDTWLAMYQVFIGEGWHSIMQLATESTNKACTWFFAGYVLIVGVVFTNLFVGVLINEFQTGTLKLSTIEGQVQLALRNSMKDLPRDDIRELMINMGHIALKMHFPDSDFHEETVLKLKKWDSRATKSQSILDKPMTLEHLTGLILLKRIRVKSFHATFKDFLECRRLLMKRHSIRAKTIVTAVIATFGAFSMTAEGTIRSDQQLLNMLDSCCENYRRCEKPAADHQIGQLTKDVQMCMNLEVQHRLSSYMKLYNLRRLTKQKYESYYGIPDPRKVPMTLLKFLQLFARVFVFALKPQVNGKVDQWQRLGRLINSRIGEVVPYLPCGVNRQASDIFYLPTPSMDQI